MKSELQPEHHWLQKLVGEWTYEHEMAMEPGGPLQKFTGTETVRTLGGFWVLCEGRGEMPGGGEAVTVMTLGYDPAKKRYVGTFIGSMMSYLWLYDGELDAAANKLTWGGGKTLVPAFDDALVIAGQGTVGLEMMRDAPDLDVILVPVGGGGLIAGVAVAAKALNPRVHVIGVESEGYPSLTHALGKGAAPTGGSTIAEGIAVFEPGTLPHAIARELVDDVVVVPEERIEEAIALGVEIEKTVLEGAGAAGLAALLEYPDRFRGRRVGVILSGGNIDGRVLSSVLLRALARSGRLIRLQIEVPDRPGVLAAVADIVGSHRGNIVDVAHHRDEPGVALKQLLLELSVETRDRAHADEIVNALTEGGFRAAKA